MDLLLGFRRKPPIDEPANDNCGLRGSMLRDFSLSATYMGLLSAFVGYSASFAILLAGMTAVGATEQQAATGLFFAALGMGVAGIILPLLTRTPSAIAWSTPGAAFLASTAVLPGGFGEAVGAFILCAVMIIITGLVPAQGRVVANIPKPIANALLAGVLLKLCFAPALALGSVPWLVLPVLLAWLAGLSLHKLAAMPLAVLALVLVLVFGVDLSGVDWSGMGAESAAGQSLLPAFDIVPPVFTLSSAISVAIPLYLVTMAGQNIPGFAVLELNNYTTRRQPLLRQTGYASLLTAPFGAVPVNMSAITAAMMCGEDAHPDPKRRYWAAVIAGFGYVVLAFAAGLVARVASVAPQELITAIAGLALIPALVASFSRAFEDTQQLEAPALTFLIAASGMTLFGVSGAFWGLVVGALVWMVKRHLGRG